jgi:hypothetical protein
MSLGLMFFTIFREVKAIYGLQSDPQHGERCAMKRCDETGKACDAVGVDESKLYFTTAPGPVSYYMSHGIA